MLIKAKSGLGQSQAPRFGFLPDLLTKTASKMLLALRCLSANGGESYCKKFQYIQ
jgi:hypothetical protein